MVEGRGEGFVDPIDGCSGLRLDWSVLDIDTTNGGAGPRLTCSSRLQPRRALSAPRTQNSNARLWATRNSVSSTSDGESFANLGMKCSIGTMLFVVFAARKRQVGLVDA